MENFVTCTKKKYRWASKKGDLAVEDLWDLPLDKGEVNLNEIAKSVALELRDAQVLDFVKPPELVKSELEIKLDIIKFIITSKLDDIKAAELKVQQADKKKRVLELIKKKQDEKLEQLDEDQLMRMLNAED